MDGRSVALHNALDGHDLSTFKVQSIQSGNDHCVCGAAIKTVFNIGNDEVSFKLGSTCIYKYAGLEHLRQEVKRLLELPQPEVLAEYERLKALIASAIDQGLYLPAELLALSRSNPSTKKGIAAWLVRAAHAEKAIADAIATKERQDEEAATFSGASPPLFLKSMHVTVMHAGFSEMVVSCTSEEGEKYALYWRHKGSSKYPDGITEGTVLRIAPMKAFIFKSRDEQKHVQRKRGGVTQWRIYGPKTVTKISC